jgi:murein DD-endopeptidase MepM/ murein hydrolase activator NlpD
LKLIRGLGAGLLLLLPVHLCERAAEADARPTARLGVPSLVVRGAVPRNTSLGKLLEHSCKPAEVQSLVDAARPLYDLGRLTVGRPFGLALGPDGLASFTYGVDDLHTLRLERVGGAWKADIWAREFDVRVDSVSGVVRSSLFAAIDAMDEQDQLALDLADIFAWDVDFNTEVQRGDSFRLSVEKLSLDGRFVKYGRILAAEFVRGPRTLAAIRFEGAAGAGYYAPDGAPLRKQFLRSPLRFTRVSSGYSPARFHPILQVVTAHPGIDFAAPEGTPVNASADGVVTLAGVTGGFGNTVKLRHANSFETLYGHLSRIYVRPGQRVTQGTPIGAVGSTGLSTGPHLHYAMFRGGAYANPMTVQSPPAEPVLEAERAAFDSTCAAALRLLDRAPRPAHLALAASVRR